MVREFALIVPTKEEIPFKTTIATQPLPLAPTLETGLIGVEFAIVIDLIPPVATTVPIALTRVVNESELRLICMLI